MKTIAVFPAHAGMILVDVPVAELKKVFPAHAGIILGACTLDRIRDVFPAHAGMIPNATNRRHNLTSVPRTRGDDPCWTVWLLPSLSCSPHTRG